MIEDPKEPVVRAVELMSTNQVRQIMFNELGLTREYIREMVRTEVEKTCNSYFNDSKLEAYIRERIDKSLRTYHYGSGELKALIAASVADAVKKAITEKLVVTVTASTTV